MPNGITATIVWGMVVIIYIEPADRERNRGILKEYWKLRKRVFCDNYGWVSANEDGTETDHLDETYSISILYVDPRNQRLGGGVRLTPTTGQTLIHSVWPDMLPNPEDFRSPNIWEATRFCVDESNTSRNQSFANRATLALNLAILDFASANGITNVIAVCEQKFFNLFEIYGFSPEIISRKTEKDGCEIGCAVWPTDETARNYISWARPFLGGVKPIQIRAA